MYGGAQFYQFCYNNAVYDNIDGPKFWSVDENKPEESAQHRVREKAFNSGTLKRAIYDEFDGEESNKSQKAFVNDLLEEKRGKPLSESDIRLDCEEYRIVFRDIARSSDERTMIASVIPPEIVCLDSVRTIKPFEIDVSEEVLNDVPLHSAYERAFTDEELFVLVGLLNSIPFDFLIRTKVNTHIPKYKFEESQTPRLIEGDEWFDYIWTRAARLNCYGDDFEQMRDRLGGVEPATTMDERREVQAELDAAAFHAYGLDRKQTAFVLEDFHRVQNPRLMDENYFQSVLEKYDELA
ncbi:hypothetical protein PN416_08660 [Halorubrum ezzemoulense]|uniref:hypothetical protein n=1 Tax=Halorubrum ezzemoulense TaxID=337243 RepID=UPI002330F8AD|nr:hypothetical protein [Halorubrum ezzemoulense]MDB9279995.1 hypothetical protein [Halorubrum ezzemoulense]MDB9283513.1 hypothetical protein [Halorubrum ezzemoulense]